MSTVKVDEILENVDGLKYDKSSKRYIPTIKYVNNVLNVNLSTLFTSEVNANDICDRCSRQFYNYIYDQKTWPEDYLKKQYIILTNEQIVRTSRDIMVSHIESTILTRRDLLVLEHGVDFDAGKLIDDYEEHIENYRFSTDTRSIFNRSRELTYKERLTSRVIDDLGVGY